MSRAHSKPTRAKETGARQRAWARFPGPTPELGTAQLSPQSPAEHKAGGSQEPHCYSLLNTPRCIQGVSRQISIMPGDQVTGQRGFLSKTEREVGGQGGGPGPRRGHGGFEMTGASELSVAVGATSLELVGPQPKPRRHFRSRGTGRDRLGKIYFVLWGGLPLPSTLPAHLHLFNDYFFSPPPMLTS